MVDPAPLEDDAVIADTGEEEVRPDDRIDDERHDEENRLKPEYLDSVREALDAGDKGAVYALVEPLHPADVADLIELLDSDDRAGFAASITDLMSSDVVAELNDHVREVMMEALSLHPEPSERPEEDPRQKRLVLVLDPQDFLRGLQRLVTRRISHLGQHQTNNLRLIKIQLLGHARELSASRRIENPDPPERRPKLPAQCC